MRRTIIRAAVAAAPTAAKNRYNNGPPSTINADRQTLYSRNWKKAFSSRFGEMQEYAAPVTNEETSRSPAAVNTPPPPPLVKVITDNRLRVAVIGGMNVGKSTLYNMLAFERVPSYHLVADAEGVTRDAVEGLARLDDIEFTAIDTPGLLNNELIDEARNILASADVVLVVMAADLGVRSEEVRLAAIVAELRLPAVLIVNKMDLVEYIDRTPSVVYDELGLGGPIPISLQSRTGVDALYEALLPHFEIAIVRRTLEDWGLEDAAMGGDETALASVRDRNSLDRYFRVAIIGRPNSGKSSLFNKLTGQNRSRESPVSGTTRDSVEVKCTYKGHRIKLIDTPGFLRIAQFRNSSFCEQLWFRTRSVMRFAHVCIVVVDSTEGCPAKGDLILGYRCIDEGKAFTFAANKWDLVGDGMATAEAIDYKLKRQLHEVKYCSAVAVSAHTGLNLSLLLDHVVTLYETWNKRVSTSRLTRFWKRLEKTVTIPHNITRINKLEQINVRPPTFMLHLQTRDERNTLPPAYENMVRNSIVEEFGFHGVPVRIFQTVKDAHKDVD